MAEHHALLIEDISKREPQSQTYYISTIAPRLARARLELRNLTGAVEAVRGAPLSSYWVMIAHAQIAAAQGDTARSERWFTRAIRTGSALADAEQAWGLVLQKADDHEGAIRLFQQAHLKAKRWEDPLFAWGQSLTAQGQHKAAVSKFAAAAVRAPRWGLLHLEWGLSLAALDRNEQAKRVLSQASGMDLLPTDRARLNQALARLNWPRSTKKAARASGQPFDLKAIET